jgi:hypothetical protein
MAQVSINLAQVGETADKALDDAVTVVVSSLTLAAEGLAGRAGRLQGAAALLKQQPGADPEEVAALEQAASQAAALQEEVRNLDARQAKRPRVAPDEWLVFGRALQPDGQPASGVLIRVAADAGEPPKDLPSAPPDEFGDFSVAYRREHFPQQPEPPSEVHVVAEGKGGQRFYESDTLVRFQAGRAEYVEITLKEKPTRRASAKRKASKASTASKPASSRRPGRRQR